MELIWGFLFCHLADITLLHRLFYTFLICWIVHHCLALVIKCFKTVTIILINMLIAYLFVFNLRLNSAISEGNAQMISQSIVLILVHTSLIVEDSVLSFSFYRFDETLITALVCTMKASFF